MGDEEAGPMKMKKPVGMENWTSNKVDPSAAIERAKAGRVGEVKGMRDELAPKGRERIKEGVVEVHGFTAPKINLQAAPKLSDEAKLENELKGIPKDQRAQLENILSLYSTPGEKLEEIARLRKEGQLRET